MIEGFTYEQVIKNLEQMSCPICKIEWIVCSYVPDEYHGIVRCTYCNAVFEIVEDGLRRING